MIEWLLATVLLPFANRHRGGWVVPQGTWYETMKLHRVWVPWLTLVAMGHGLSPVALACFAHCAMRVGWGSPKGRHRFGGDQGLEEYEKLAPEYFTAHPLVSLALVGVMQALLVAVPGTALGLMFRAEWGFLWWLVPIYAIAIPVSCEMYKHVGDLPTPVEWSGAGDEAYQGLLMGLLAGAIAELG